MSCEFKMEQIDVYENGNGGITLRQFDYVSGEDVHVSFTKAQASTICCWIQVLSTRNDSE